MLKAPFPWFGGKSRIAHEVWNRFGPVQNYVEPFCGTAAVLLARPDRPRIETVNDANCFIANFWRAVATDAEAVADLCDWPVNEADLHARHRWLMTSAASLEWRERMKRDPDFYDVKVAAWWCWGACQWIGTGWCDEGKMFGKDGDTPGQKRPSLASSKGMLSRIATEAVLWQQPPDLGGSRGAAGRGIHASGLTRKIPNLSGHYTTMGEGTHAAEVGREAVLAWFQLLQDRLRRVRVTCGDWARVCTPAVTTGIGLTAVFLDPPYSGEADRDAKLYAVEDLEVAHAARAWCLERGSDPLLRIALCGYEGEHESLEAAGWSVHVWRTKGGYGNQAEGGRGSVNRHRERIWFSPHCLSGQSLLF